MDSDVRELVELYTRILKSGDADLAKNLVTELVVAKAVDLAVRRSSIVASAIERLADDAA